MVRSRHLPSPKLLALAGLLLVLACCARAPQPAPPANYSTDVTLHINNQAFRYEGVGFCYAAASIFTFGLTMPNGDNLGFSVPLDVGSHTIDRSYTALWLRPDGLDSEATSGSITVNHWDVRDRADGELSGSGSKLSVSGHWGCRFARH
jgi:hypothetical protein